MTAKEQKFLYQTLGNQIRSFRENSGLSQNEFGNALNLSRASIVNIEKGRQNPSLHLLLEISKVFNVKFTDFFKDDIWQNDTGSSKSSRIDDEIRKMTSGEGRTKVNEFLKQITS